MSSNVYICFLIIFISILLSIISILIICSSNTVIRFLIEKTIEIINILPIIINRVIITFVNNRDKSLTDAINNKFNIKRTSNDSDVCSICLDNIKSGDYICEYECNEKCNSKFHSHCILLLLLHGDTKCPNCRLSIIELHEFVHVNIHLLDLYKSVLSDLINN